nr:hypothetical protein [Hymenobacter psoromatis]
MHDALTIQDIDWRGKKNGELLKLLVEHKFEAFLTADKKMCYEQNWQRYSVAVIFLDVLNLKYDTVKLFISQVLALLAQSGLAGGVYVGTITAIGLVPVVAAITTLLGAGGSS